MVGLELEGRDERLLRLDVAVAAQFGERERVEQRDFIRLELETAPRRIGRFVEAVEPTQRRGADQPVLRLRQGGVTGATERIERGPLVSQLEVVAGEREAAVPLICHGPILQAEVLLELERGA